MSAATYEFSDNLKNKFDKIIDMGAKALKQGEETIEAAISAALSLRDNVLMVRINKESLKKLDELVEAGLFKSRSESAAFLIREGIKARADLFEKIAEKTNEIKNLKEELKNIVNAEFTSDNLKEE